MIAKRKWEASHVLVSRFMGADLKHVYITGTDGKWEGRTIADVGFWLDMDGGECEANAALIVAAANACFEVNPANPLAVAQNINEAVELLKAASNLLQVSANDNEILKDAIGRVLAKIEATE